MKIVCMSDSHMQHEHVTVPDGDIFIHSGDALGRGTVSETIRFNQWLGTLPHKHKIFVPGNHDELFEMNPEVAKELLSNATVLIDESVQIGGLKIYGSPWTPTFYDWSFMKSDSELASVWEKIPNGLDILITHGPPYGILDFNKSGNLCGSQTLYRAVADKQPRFHIFGHIHQASGTLQHNSTTFINAAILNDWYNLVCEPKVFDIL